MNKPKGYLDSKVAADRDAQSSERLFRSLRTALGSLCIPEKSSADQFSLIEPQISTEGVHVWPFDLSCPVDVLFMRGNDHHRVRMNRHRYFEVLYLCSGSAECLIQDRVLSLKEGDLAILGGSMYHSIECHSSGVAFAALFFEPDFIRFDGGSDSAEYLTPFLLQDSTFPHIVPAETGVPEHVLNMMLRIRSELPALSSRARLALGTYLKMLLLLLLNHYASYVETVESFQREQFALDRLVPLFRFLAENSGNATPIREAARLCSMSESYFMSFFKRVTGLTFIEYLNRYRTERAQMMLLNTDESIATISQEVGYCDQAYFGAVFRKLVGMTPATYRRRFRVSSFLAGNGHKS
jgi:AraC-like DNA-binding protein